MARGILWIGLLGLLAPALGAGGVRVAGPVIRIEPSQVDFGTLAQGELATADFTIHNDGTELLQILKTDSDCGCTLARIPDSLLAPGAATSMSIMLQTRSFSGSILKHVTVFSNDPAAPRARITLAAHVRPTVRVSATSIAFGAVACGSRERRTIELRAAAADTLRILGYEVAAARQTLGEPAARTADSLHSEARLAVTIEGAESEGDSTLYRVHLETRAGAPPGPFTLTHAIRTNLVGALRVPLHISGQFYSFFVVEPTVLSFGGLPQSREKTISVMLTGRGEGRRHVLGVRCADERLAARVVEHEAGRRYEVEATIPAGAEPGQIQTRLTIETDDPRQPQIDLEVRALVRRSRR
jgi:hypothetical protein